MWRRSGNPWRQLTDQVGVRVICYYVEDVDRIVAALRRRFEVDEKRSVDKRSELQVRQFGYRSVHLIARFGDRGPEIAKRWLRYHWFEIQVRSILEHAWAEIEHEICYKSGVEYPDSLLRRFSALAGSLEILDAQFLALSRESGALIDSFRAAYQAGRDLDDVIDVARLVALFEAIRPAAPGWRTKDDGLRRFRPRSAAVCVEALGAAGIRTARRIQRILGTKRFKGRIIAYAAQNGIAANEVSHLALTMLVIGTAKPSVLRLFPDLPDEPLLRDVLRN